MTDYQPLEALRLEQDLLAIGLESAAARISCRIVEILGTNDIDLKDNLHASTLGDAIWKLQDRRHLLPIQVLESVVARCSYNGSASAIRMIAAHASREAFDALIAIHINDQDLHLREVVLDSLEALAGRLGLRVRWQDGRLEASSS